MGTLTECVRSYPHGPRPSGELDALVAYSLAHILRIGMVSISREWFKNWHAKILFTYHILMDILEMPFQFVTFSECGIAFWAL